MEGKFNASELQLRNAISLIAELSGRVQALEGVNADGSRSKGENAGVTIPLPALNSKGICRYSDVASRRLTLCQTLPRQEDAMGGTCVTWWSSWALAEFPDTILNHTHGMNLHFNIRVSP